MERQRTNILFGETIFSFDNRPSDVLEYGSIGYLENLEGEFPSAEELAKSGRGAKKGKHLKAFWKAQCAFRGLDVNGRIEELVDRLRTNEHKPVFPELVKVQKDLRQKAVDELEDAWKNRLTDSQKAEEDVKRFLLETFPINSNEDKAVLHTLRLRHDWKGPRKQFDDPPNKWQDAMWMVVGRSRSTISENVKDIGRSRHRTKQRAQEEAQAFIEEGSREVLRASKKQGWNARGEWHISCPAFEEKYDVEGLMKLTIYTSITSSCLQIFSEFDFGIVAGVFRFEKQSASEPRTEADNSTAAKLQVAKNNRLNEMQAGGKEIGAEKYNTKNKMAERRAKRKLVELERNRHEEVSEIESENESGDECESESESESETKVDTDYWDTDANNSDIKSNDPSAKAFHLHKFSEPSVRNRTFNYRWRGELHPGTCRERVELDSDKDLYTITFDEPKGTRLRGTFGSHSMGPHVYTFTGIKIGFVSKKPPEEMFSGTCYSEPFEIRRQWRDRSRQVVLMLFDDEDSD
ncbi:hypothetical protein BCON_0153g00230 [Botryotinia convoluta]|uniref:Uncharacterized protein n=1 Tax=Botryotinia convoluta TaxID=54673 RepID=A0A4Z1HS09_9HELO|nr:hypothetical protein BCON_0153g00230 [Botryotinia convoluta]